MLRFGKTSPGKAAKETGPTASPKLELVVHDTLASGRRLWVRGFIANHCQPNVLDGRSWWERWRRNSPTAPAPTLHLQTKTAAGTLESEILAAPDGRFEALLEADLPPTRRGWRVLRHQVTCNGQPANASSVALAPPEEGTTVALVVLPLAITFEPAEKGQPIPLEKGENLARELQRLTEEVSPAAPFFYLACVPPGREDLQSELALTATTLGWPEGPVVVLPASRQEAVATLARGLERLRWLFAGNVDLVVLNRELAAEESLAALSRPKENQADVHRYFGPDESPGRRAAPGPAIILGDVPRPGRPGLTPRHPVVFCHGMLAMSMLRMQIPEDCNYFSHLRSCLRDRGVRALFPRVEPTGGAAARAEQLRDQIRHWTDEPVNLIGHSMGGLDARFLIGHLGMADRVRSLTTVATPHHGTALADWFCANFRHRVPLLTALEAFGINVDGFRDCQLAACRAFNDRTPDAPGVRYFSYGSAVTPARLTPLLRRAWNILTPLEGPNDGLVSVRSARWGDYLGTLSVDHFAQTPDGLFVRDGENFDSAGFFLRLVEDLARRGL
jgi:triacylglycerol lipase